MTTTTLPRAALALSLASLLLAGCGGRDDEAAPPVDERAVPASALVSAESFSRYAAARPADDRAEPLEVEGLAPPTSETAEPVDVN